MTLAYPTINGHYFSFSSLEIDVNGTMIRAFKEVSWELSVEAGEIYGNHPQQLGDTRGKLSGTGSLTLYLPEWVTLRKALGNGYMRKRWPISLVFSETDGPVDVERVQMTGVRIMKVGPTVSEGVDGVEVSLDLHMMRIKEGDEDPFEEMLSPG